MICIYMKKLFQAIIFLLSKVSLLLSVEIEGAELFFEVKSNHNLFQIHKVQDCSCAALECSNPTQAIQLFRCLQIVYESEFQQQTGNRMNLNGNYVCSNGMAIDSEWSLDRSIFLAIIHYKDSSFFQPVGFAVVNNQSMISNVGNEVCFDMAEFFINFAYRKQKLGKLFATILFNNHPGTWEVRQLQSALTAHDFWWNVINEYTNGDFVEITNHPSWHGPFQRFNSQQPL